jgi:hypothetical protein
MKAILTPVSVLLLTFAANAQPSVSVNPHDVSIVKFSWIKEKINWEANPFGGTTENFHEMQFRARAERTAADAKRAGRPDADKLAKDAQTDAAIVRAEREKKGPPRYVFFYRLTVKNNGTKAIKEIDWDYVFSDAATGEELGRREFTSVEKLGAGKTKELSFVIATPPTRRISVHSLDRKERAGLSEKAVIMRVQFLDGTVWQRP